MGVLWYSVPGHLCGFVLDGVRRGDVDQHMVVSKQETVIGAVGQQFYGHVCDIADVHQFLSRFRGFHLREWGDASGVGLH